MDVETPAKGRDKTKGFSLEKRRTFHRGTLAEPYLRGGGVPSSLEHWPWKAQDVTQEAHDVIQLHERFARQSWQFRTCGRLEKPKEG
jgi:hypothetical protein